ncbi:MAG: oxygen-dependent coproporphyrinogen oxidase [Microscillaceae bacterium]
MDRNEIAAYFQDLQNRICQALEEADGPGRFREDRWQRPGGGGGHTRILQGGRVIEKGGVNFSAVHGQLPEVLREKMQMEGRDFFASGVSIVLHPHNPHVPIIHMNIRYFEMDAHQHWFGGGIDLTPHYVEPEQARHFHQSLKAVCDRFDPDYYPAFKKWADEYFFIRHRHETRGIGGIFFDRLRPDARHNQAARFSFVQAVGEAFAPVYTHLMHLNAQKPFSEAEKNWQLLRRGRYVEFNLVYDQGTKFGLETEGRIESILMSLPQHASWQYDYQPLPGSREAETQHYLRKGVDWAG